MIEDIGLIFGALFMFGPFAAWVVCSKSGAHKNEPPDILGAALALLNPVLVGLVSLVFAQTQARWLGALIVLVIEVLLWRRVLRGTNCAAKMSRMLSRAREMSGLAKRR
jgi:branched-subunit amino acid ABC-type transport system permease component